jgi:hypothetical protein
MTDVLSSSTTPLTRRAVPWTSAIAIGTTAVLVAAVGTAVAVVGAVGGGQQPEDVLPASTVAVVKVDLDPPFAQQKAVYDLSKKFPSVHADSVGSIKDDLLSSLFFNSTDLAYARDIKPWLGDRAAIAAVPDGSSDGFAPVAAVQYTDKDKASTALTAAQKRSTDESFGYAFSGDYVIVANTKQEAEKYADSDKHLADSDTFNDAVDALDGDQIITGWVDVKRLYATAPKDVLQSSPLQDISVDPSGSFVIGAHANSGYLEIQGKAVDVGDSLKQYGAGSFGAGHGANLIAAMPIDATAALEVTGLGDTMTKAYSSLSKQEGFQDVEQSARDAGLTLPDDLRKILGTDLAAAVFGDLKGGSPSVAAHVVTDDAAGAVQTLNRVAATGDTPGFAVQTDGGGGYYIGTSPSAITHATNGTLGESEPFKRALPDAKNAGFAVYVSIGRIAALLDEPPADITNLEAFGMTANAESGEFRIRLTVR